MLDNQPRDKKGNPIGIGNTLIARRDDGEELRYRVLAIDRLQGSGSVQLECLSPVEPGFERRWESRHWLWRLYEIEQQEEETELNREIVDPEIVQVEARDGDIHVKIQTGGESWIVRQYQNGQWVFLKSIGSMNELVELIGGYVQYYELVMMDGYYHKK